MSKLFKGLGKIFGLSGGEKPQIIPPTPAPTITDPSVQNAEIDARRRAKSTGTILTSGLGDTSEAPVKKKTLLGG